LGKVREYTERWLKKCGDDGPHESLGIFSLQGNICSFIITSKSLAKGGIDGEVYSDSCHKIPVRDLFQ